MGLQPRLSSAGDNWQICAFPHPLLECLGELRYLDGWKFSLEHLDRGQGSTGLTLVIELTQTKNSYRKPPDDPRHKITVHHLFVVPAAAYNKQSWRRWLLDRILDVHLHEACENFDVTCSKCEGSGWLETDFSTHHVEPCDKCEGEGYIKPFAPNHDPGHDPYTLENRLP